MWLTSIQTCCELEPKWPSKPTRFAQFPNGKLTCLSGPRLVTGTYVPELTAWKIRSLHLEIKYFKLGLGSSLWGFESALFCTSPYPRLSDCGLSSPRALIVFAPPMALFWPQLLHNGTCQACMLAANSTLVLANTPHLSRSIFFGARSHEIRVNRQGRR